MLQRICVMKKARNSLRWMRLDNAAKIYPAALRKGWSNVFRLSATLTEEVDCASLRRALDAVVPRFPSMAARLRKGIFWYYLEQLPAAPELTEEAPCPVRPMTQRELRRCALRVIVYRRRIAVEFFHSLTDGTGGLIFLKTLLAEYLHMRYGILIPPTHGVLSCGEAPLPAELEDSFPKYAAPVRASRKETNAWRLTGTREATGFRNLICFRLSTEEVRAAAEKHGVTVTVFLCAALMEALLALQAEKIPNRRFRRLVKVLLPVNLRPLFGSSTLRNFAMYTTPEADPRLGDYTFEELCSLIRHRMGLEVTAKHMGTRIATNVRDEQSLAVKLLPLFIKNAVMKAIFDAVGEKKSCLSLSNLGLVRLPESMVPYIERLDFILGTQAKAPHNCAVIAWGDTLCINFIRNIRESDLELHFFRCLRAHGLHVLAESNRQNKREKGM